MSMSPEVRVQRAITKARSRGRDNAVVPTVVLAELLVEKEADRRTREALVRLAASLGRRYPPSAA